MSKTVNKAKTKINLSNLTSVEFSNIQAIGFEKDTTYVLFKNGNVYSYPQTSMDSYNELIKAESVGSFFSKTYRKLDQFEKLENVELAKKNEKKEQEEKKKS